ncbi:MAG: PorT family protein [Bacteroidia bacterium]|nr:PorT family protein [Bacteroidia bacterium]
MSKMGFIFLSLLWAQRFEMALCGGPQIPAQLTRSGDYDLRWRGIGFIGGVYETFWFAKHWGVSVEAQYVWARFDKGASLSTEVTRFVTSLRLPLISRYQVPLTGRIRLELGAGGYAGWLLSAEEDVRGQTMSGMDTTYTVNLFDRTQAGAEIHRRGGLGLVFTGGVRTRRLGLSLWHDTMLGRVNDPRLSAGRRWYNHTTLRLCYLLPVREE